jgi:hypothetical protein
MINPFGILDALVGMFDLLGLSLGKKRRKESKLERISFVFFYVLMLCGGVGTICFFIWKAYFQNP